MTSKHKLRSYRIRTSDERFKPEHREVIRKVVRTKEDLEAYKEELAGGQEAVMTHMIKYQGPKLDHAVPKSGEERSLFRGALANSDLKGTNPLYEIEGLALRKYLTVCKLVNSGKTVLINDVGGYYYLTDKEEIMEEVDVTNRDVRIKEGTTTITLENDPMIDHNSSVSKYDTNFSYVLNLRRNMDNLQQIFKDFEAAGGQFAYIYTTAIDEQQVLDYFDVIIKHTDIEEVVLDFVDLDQRIDDLLVRLYNTYELEFDTNDKDNNIITVLISR